MSRSTNDRSGYRHLAYIALHYSFIDWIRYPINAVGQVIASVVTMGGVFYGGRVANIPTITDSFAGILVGFFLWSLVANTYQKGASLISNEASWGTLERHFVSPFSFERVLIMKYVALILRQAILSTVVLFCLIFVTGTQLQIPVLTITMILLFSVLPIAGIGFAMGGLAVLYKRVGSLVGFLQFPIIALVSAPAVGTSWFRLLPVVQGSAMLQEAMKNGRRLTEFGLPAMGTLVLVGLSYSVAGFLVFRFCQQRARELGVLGDY